MIVVITFSLRVKNQLSAQVIGNFKKNREHRERDTK